MYSHIASDGKDKEFAENILAFSEHTEMVDYTFGDLLLLMEINALKDRLAGIAEAIRRYPQHRLLSGDEWDQASAGEYFRINPNLNYMSRFIHYLNLKTHKDQARP